MSDQSALMTRSMVRRNSASSRSTLASNDSSMFGWPGMVPRSVDSEDMTVKLLHRCWWPRHHRHDQPNHKPTQRELAVGTLRKYYVGHDGRSSTNFRLCVVAERYVITTGQFASRCDI